MDDMTAAQAARQNTRDGGGKYATMPRHEAPLGELELDDFEKAMERFPQNIHLFHASYDDELSDEQVEELLCGDVGALEESVNQAVSEHLDLAAREEAEQYWDDLHREGVVSVPAQDAYDDIYELANEFRAGDSSDPASDLARNTKPKLMRTRLAPRMDMSLGYVGAPRNSWHGPSTFNEDTPEAAERIAARERAIAYVLDAADVNVEDPAVKEAISELVTEGPYDWHEQVDLDVIFYDDVTNVAPDSMPGTTTSYTFKDAHVVLIDRANGSGHDVKIPGQLRHELPPMEEGGLDYEKSIFLDDSSNIGGYGWDETAGVYKPAFKTEVIRNVD